jgi:hypothetical protein
MRPLFLILLAAVLSSSPDPVAAQQQEFSSRGFASEYMTNAIYKGKYNYLFEVWYPVEYVSGFLKAASEKCSDAFGRRARVSLVGRVFGQGQQEIQSKMVESFKQWVPNPGSLMAKAALKQGTMNAARDDGRLFTEQHKCDSPIAERMFVNANAVLNGEAMPYSDPPASASLSKPISIEPKIKKLQRMTLYDYYAYEIPEYFAPPIPDPRAEDLAIVKIKIQGNRGVGGLKEIWVEIFPPSGWHAMHFDREHGPIDRPMQKYAKQDVAKIQEDMTEIFKGKHYLLSCIYQLAVAGETIGIDRYWWKEVPPAADPARLAKRLAEHPYLLIDGARSNCPPRI